jgi:hypothetical protein
MRMKKLIVIVVAMSMAAYAGYRVLGDDGDGRREDRRVVATESLALDRIWIEKLPRNDKEIINVFAALSEHSIGIFDASSQWKGAFEIFRFESHGDELRIVYPQTNERETVKARARKCNEKGMDFCLEMSGSSRGIKKYYSREGWEIDGASSLDDIQAQARALTAP